MLDGVLDGAPQRELDNSHSPHNLANRPNIILKSTQPKPGTSYQPNILLTMLSSLETSSSSSTSSSSQPQHDDVLATSVISSLHGSFSSYTSSVHTTHRLHRHQRSDSSKFCQDSYKLFKKCATASETECFSCSDAVARYWAVP